jgi:hypothetical protein
MCCGRSRAKIRAAMTPNARAEAYRPASPPTGTVSFINVGARAATVVGPVSGREYRFDRPGAVVAVDARDRVLLASLRQLRQI